MFSKAFKSLLFAAMIPLVAAQLRPNRPAQTDRPDRPTIRLDLCPNTAVCTRSNGQPGIMISKKRKTVADDGAESEECLSQCVSSRRGTMLVARGAVACGKECQEPTSVIDNCLDTDACGDEGRQKYLVNFQRRGECMQRCVAGRRAAHGILTKRAKCGPCPAV